MDTVTISRSAYQSILAHGEEGYPHECCGVLLGLAQAGGWRVHRVIRAANSAGNSAHRRYEIAPADLVRIQREAARLNMEIAGFYHSHPDHQPQWSETDLAEAHWIGCCYLITEVMQGRASRTRSFLLAGTKEEDKRFEQQGIEVEDGSVDGQV